MAALRGCDSPLAIAVDGASLRLSPVLGKPGKNPGLFQLAGHGAALEAGRRHE